MIGDEIGLRLSGWSSRTDRLLKAAFMEPFQTNLYSFGSFYDKFQARPAGLELTVPWQCLGDRICWAYS